MQLYHFLFLRIKAMDPSIHRTITSFPAVSMSVFSEKFKSLSLLLFLFAYGFVQYSPLNLSVFLINLPAIQASLLTFEPLLLMLMLSEPQFPHLLLIGHKNNIYSAGLL